MQALDDPDADAMMNYRGCHGSPKRTSRTPLLQAAANGDVKSVDILLVNGADANEREPQTGMTALHLSTTCRGGNTSIINSLIKDGHANPALRDKQGVLLTSQYFGGPGMCLSASEGRLCGVRSWRKVLKCTDAWLQRYLAALCTAKAHCYN